MEIGRNTHRKERGREIKKIMKVKTAGGWTKMMEMKKTEL